MAAICDSCEWTGASTQVVDARCPECRGVIRYERKELQAAPLAIRTTEQFNCRAAAALRSVDFAPFSNTNGIVAEFLRQHAASTVSEKMQQAIYNIVHRYRRQITDQLVLDFAATRARGAD